MPLYETVLIARNDVTQQQVEGIANRGFEFHQLVGHLKRVVVEGAAEFQSRG